jgi:hypothetical protein
LFFDIIGFFEAFVVLLSIKPVDYAPLPIRSQEEFEELAGEEEEKQRLLACAWRSGRRPGACDAEGKLSRIVCVSVSANLMPQLNRPLLCCLMPFQDPPKGLKSARINRFEPYLRSAGAWPVLFSAGPGHARMDGAQIGPVVRIGPHFQAQAVKVLRPKNRNR